MALTASLSLLACLPDADMRATSLIVVASLPLAYLGAWVEQRYRKRQNLSHNQLMTWNRRHAVHPYTPDRLVIRALFELLVLNFLLHLACVLALLPLLRTLLPWLPGGPQPSWPMLWLAAAAGAILALRLPRAYALTGVTLAVGIAATL